MWPWGHLAIGYVVYAAHTRYRYDEYPAGLPAVALAIGTQFPDLLDKPLAYTWAVLPAGRSLAHSLLLALPFCLLVLAAVRGRRPMVARGGGAFVLGYLTHLFGDAVYPLLALETSELTFLVWPALAAPEYEATSFAYHVEDLLESTRSMRTASGLLDPFALEIFLFVLAVGLWIWHRAPPFPTLARSLHDGESPTPDG